MAFKFTQLTAVGNTDSHKVVGFTDHLFVIVVASINTSVDYNVQGTVDNTNWFDLATSDVQKTANGVYYLSYNGLALVAVRGSMTAEVGGAAVTLDITYQGSSD